jgi:N-acetylneuraminic acid mutarotase
MLIEKPAFVCFVSSKTLRRRPTLRPTGESGPFGRCCFITTAEHLRSAGGAVNLIRLKEARFGKLVFSSDRPGGSGGLDLYFSTRPSWRITGNLNTGRQFHTETLLPNGKVLVAGGNDSNRSFKSAELYDPATGTWNRTADLNTDRNTHTATFLQNGMVLVAGGFSCGPPPQVCFGLNSAELYDPATGTWTGTGNLNRVHDGHTATLLTNGKVLVVSGDENGNSAELYDPNTGTWSNTGNLNTARDSHTATLLQNGKVLVAGGASVSGNDALNSAELYDPDTGTWSNTGSLNTARELHTATLLSNGKVLVASGFVNFSTGQVTNSAELYDPATGIWTVTGNLNQGSAYHTATLLTGGKVLVAGGFFVDGLPNITNRAELYDPVTGTWSNTVTLNMHRRFHTATLLLNGKVLAAGGTFADKTAELYDSGTNQIDDARFFVRQHYFDSLSREPDQGGSDYWTDRITQCGSDARCIHERRIGVSAAFFIELEFQDSGYYVYRFYKASFGRQPNYAEFTADRGRVIGGSNLEANKQAFADEWVQRPVFLGAYPNTMSNTEFVNKLFDSAGLTASMYDQQRQQEIAALNAGRSRALVLRDVIEIPDFKNIPDQNDPRYAVIKQISQYNPAFVLMQYLGYLRRNVDQSGYDFWLDVVNNREPNNYHGMVCAFITSTEYQLRFGSVVTHNNADCSP